MDTSTAIALFTVYSNARVATRTHEITTYQFVDSLPWLIPLYIAAGLIILVCIVGIITIVRK